MTNENINVNTAAADRVDPQTLEAMQMLYETCFDDAFGNEDNSNDINQFRELIVKPYCKKHGIKDNSPMAQMYFMFVIGFDSGMDFVQRLDNISK